MSPGGFLVCARQPTGVGPAVRGDSRAVRPSRRVGGARGTSGAALKTYRKSSPDVDAVAANAEGDLCPTVTRWATTGLIGAVQTSEWYRAWRLCHALPYSRDLSTP